MKDLKLFEALRTSCLETTAMVLNIINGMLMILGREISEKLGIAAYSIDDIDKVGIGEIMQRALERINPE